MFEQPHETHDLRSHRSFLFLFVLISAFPAQAAKTISVEAESGGLTAPMVIQFDDAASGGQFVEAPLTVGDNLNNADNGGPGEVSFSMNITEGGKYVLWARTLTPNGKKARGSFDVTRADKKIKTWVVPKSTTWKWNKVANLALTPGALSLAFTQRDNGTKFDRIILSSVKGFNPNKSNLGGADFTIIALPDTQFYSRDSSPAFAAQTQWIVDNRVLKNIVYVAHLGDIVENAHVASEWDHASEAMSLLEDPETTGLPDGIPYGVAVGNHDQNPQGNPAGNSTQLYNTYFGESRFSGRGYYGGHFGSSNDSHFSLFSAGGMDFIVIYLEYDPSSDSAVLEWADNLLKTHIDRRAIIVSHYIIEPGDAALFGPQGQALYDALKGNANLFLMLAGHRPGEGRRADIFNDNAVHTLLSNYQDRGNGGGGWLRILEFSPANNQIRVRTYSPTLGEFETDADSQFTLSYDMTPNSNFPPVTRVGPDQMITLPDWADLDGSVTDDGLPAPPGTLATTWSKVSGPGAVTFGDVNAVDTTASFSEAGPYLLQLATDDGEKRSSADVVILVSPETPELVTFELDAENGVLTAPMEIRSAPNASGGEYVIVPEGSGDNFDDSTRGGPGQVSLSFNLVQGGAYNLWARTIAPTGASDSFYVTHGGTLIREWTVPGSAGWQWNKVAEVFLGAGPFDVEFRQREDGTWLDKVLLTNDLSFVPN